MFDAPKAQKWSECVQRLDACTEKFSVTKRLFLEALQRREDLYALIRTAEKAKDSAAVVELGKRAPPLETEYDSAARAFAEAQRNLAIACQSCKKTFSGSGNSSAESLPKNLD